MHFGWQNAARLAPKSSQKSIWEGSREGPGGSWEALGGQNRKKRRATRFGGPSWGRLGVVLGGSGVQDGA